MEVGDTESVVGSCVETPYLFTTVSRRNGDLLEFKKGLGTSLLLGPDDAYFINVRKLDLQLPTQSWLDPFHCLDFVNTAFTLGGDGVLLIQPIIRGRVARKKTPYLALVPHTLPT